jgi:hypothetical protein
MSTQHPHVTTPQQMSGSHQPHPRTAEWLVLALVLASTVVMGFAILGSLSTGTSLAVLAVIVGGFVLAIGALFDRPERPDHLG